MVIVNSKIFIINAILSALFVNGCFLEPKGVEIVWQDSGSHGDMGGDVDGDGDGDSDEAPGCGDFNCDEDETAQSCPDDCPETCGDGFCTHTETVCSCSSDCGDVSCADGLCCPTESTCTCVADCGESCGDGCCNGTETAASCSDDCSETCNDGICSPSEDVCNCPIDCGENVCGDSHCCAGDNTCSCPDDCGTACPDECCNGGETLDSCFSDCATHYRRSVTACTSCSTVPCPPFLTDFPLLIRIVDDIELRSVTHGGHVANDDGSDITFTEVDSTTNLDHEIEFYDPASGTLVTWVRVPTLSLTAATVMFLYYGDWSALVPTENPEAVWADSFFMVQHFEESSGTLLDSTGNNNDSDSEHGMTYRSAGQIGDGLYFDESDDYFTVDDFSFGAVFTISLWARVQDNFGFSYQYFFSHGGWRENPSVNMTFPEIGSATARDTVVAIFDDGTSDETLRSDVSAGGFDATDGSWHHISVTRVNGGLNKLYIDGVLRNTILAPDTRINPSGSINIGRRSDGDSSRYFGGWLDEIRISGREHSECWVESEYLNQSDPSSFVIIGDEEVL